jgi:hypothetical protein
VLAARVIVTSDPAALRICAIVGFFMIFSSWGCAADVGILVQPIGEVKGILEKWRNNERRQVKCETREFLSAIFN